MKSRTSHFLKKLVVRLPIIISTGMANLEEIKLALDVLLNKGATLEQVTIAMHNFVSTPSISENLRAIDQLQIRSDVKLGFQIIP